MPFGMTLSDGRENDGRSGRLVSRAFIGDLDVYKDDYRGRFFYGAIFRSHPSSDKIMRSRLEIAGASFAPRCLSRLCKRAGSFSPCRVTSVEQDGSGACSTSTVARMSPCRRTGPKRSRAPLAVNWNSFRRGADNEKDRRSRLALSDGCPGFVADDFGYQICFESDEVDGGYKIKGLGPKGDGEKTVETVDQLRRLAAEELNPISPARGLHTRAEPFPLNYLIHSKHIDDVFNAAKRVPEDVAIAETRGSDVVLWLRISEAQGDGVLVGTAERSYRNFSTSLRRTSCCHRGSLASLPDSAFADVARWTGARRSGAGAQATSDLTWFHG